MNINNSRYAIIVYKLLLLVINRMNIVQAYTKFKNQFIILISGFSGSGKTKISKFIAELFGFQHIDLAQFYYPTNVFDKKENYITLKNGVQILNWDDVYKSVDWDKFNTFVNDNKNKGIVIVGFGFPKSLLKFDPDFHIQIKINKKNLLDNREKYIKSRDSTKNKDIIDVDTDKNILNNITYPMHIKLNEESKIDKFINANDTTDEKVKEETFSYLIHMIEKWLSDYNSQKRNNDSISQTSSKTKLTFGKHTSKPNDKPRIHNEGNAKAYDEFYYPNKKRVLYDFNDEGNDYPEEYLNRVRNKDKKSDSDTSSDSSDAEFLFTTNGREFIGN